MQVDDPVVENVPALHKVQLVAPVEDQELSEFFVHFSEDTPEYPPAQGGYVYDEAFCDKSGVVDPGIVGSGGDANFKTSDAVRARLKRVASERDPSYG